ncbi:hypothetical protein BU16DRAFT_548812 [Lophium mytilinum]|uniref:Dihydrofolate reductase n=1 Tax=Lophium mytilinum TaxID=390894 RepID=A0A6A6R1E1_9PEZI|nr:hypothetical protein BU16DRAFT_548812 [Lophium mytilinum]
MPPPTPSLPLTLILAATPSLGIGRAGALPWKSLKADMAFFARVTKRVPGVGGGVGAAGAAGASPSPSPTNRPTKTQNAVIMGRKTWDSIPPRFRPLAGRVNVVVSRSGAVAGLDAAREREKVLVAGGLGEAVGVLQKGVVEEVGVGRVFVIGGASLYEQALRMEGARRVVLTKVGREFECDAFFGVDLEGEGARGKGWVRRSRGQLEEWVGEKVEAGEEAGVGYEFCLFEREGA